MKRLLVLLALVGALAAPGRLAAQQIHVGLGGQLSSIVHVPIVIPIVADLTGRPEKLGSYSLRLQWNPAVLQITGGGDGTFGGATVNDDSLTAGVLRMAGVSSAGASGVVTLVNIELVPLVKAVDTLKLSVTGLYAAGTFADLDSLAVVSNGFYCPARGLWGDIDGDGNANSRDALIALSNAVGLDVSAFDISLGDVDGNGLTNARDALIILSNAVGVDVSAYRVMRLVGGACSALTGVGLSVTPGPVELVRGQTVQFEAWAVDSATGALQAVANPTWKSNASMVLVVGPDGEASARDTGTAVVTALRGLRDSAQTTVHVIDRRTTHWVDAAAAGAQNRLGTTDLPFGTLDEGLQFAQAGDTLRVRLGTYHPQNGTLAIFQPLVVIGDTAADGSRPVIVPDPSQAMYDGDAIDILAPGRVELQNLALSGAETGVWVNGTDCTLLRGIRMSTTGDGVYIGMPSHCVRIEHSVILGPDLPYLDAPPARGSAPRGPVHGVAPSAGAFYAGNGVTTDAPLDTLTIEDTEIGGFYYGVSLSTQPDSTTIRRSFLHDFIYAAVTTGGGGPCYDCAPPIGRPATRSRPARSSVARSAMDALSQPAAVVIEASRMERTQYGSLVDLEASFRRVAFAHNVMSNPGGDVLYLYGSGSSGSGGYVSLVGDSIVSPPENPHVNWLDAQYFDSLVMDSLQAVGFAYGSTYDVPLVRLTNSTLRDLQGNCGECTGTALYVDFGSIVPGVMVLSNDSVVGDPHYDAAGIAFSTYGARLDADRVTAVNLYRGIYAEDDDSGVTVTNSLFRHVAYPVEWYPNGSPAPSGNGLTVRGSTFSGFDNAVTASNGVLVADSNTFADGSQAIAVSGQAPVTVTRNQTTGIPAPVQIHTWDSTVVVTVTDNVLSGVEYYGVMATTDYGQDTPQTLFDLRRNTVTCDATGATGGTGLDVSEARLVVLDNQVNGCWEGIRTVVSLTTARGDSIVGNTVTAPPSALFGIGVAGNILARVGRNTVTGAATGGQTAALIDADGTCGWWACPDNGTSVVTIDSNSVSGGTRWGIRAQDSDSLVLRGNTVQNLNSATAGYTPYTSDLAGIAVMGYLGRFAAVVGNVVKSIFGNGIVVSHGDVNVVLVDSNVVADIDTIVVSPDAGHGGTGISLPWGPALLTRNLLTGARRNGVWITMGDSVGLTGNNIAGNLPYGARVDYDRGYVDAFENYWGDVLGPRDVQGDSGSVVGDSVSGVSWSPFRVAQNDSAPTVVPAAPRFLARARPMAPVRASRALALRDSPVGPKDRFAVPRAPAPKARPTTGPFAERRAAEARDRAERAMRLAQRLQQLRAEAEARERAVRAAHAPPDASRRQGVRP